jgi:hypothetical protein
MLVLIVIESTSDTPGFGLEPLLIKCGFYPQVLKYNYFKSIYQ